jgi:MinD superfamily P-loop ATPase
MRDPDDPGVNPMIIAVASGKGGTGKTTVAVNLALSLDSVQLIDCDVEEPNAHLFLKPEIHYKKAACVQIPEIIEERCNECGLCQEVCAFNSIVVLPAPEGARKGSVLVFPNLCHSCGACFILCPQAAIREIEREIGVVESGWAGPVAFAHGKLNIGEAMAPPLIRQVKKLIDPGRTVIIDAPPGTSCPVIESVKGADFCILVTEPTPFGLHDMQLAVEMLKTIGIPFGLIINRSDIGDDQTDEYALENQIPVFMRIPFDRGIAELYSRGMNIIDSKKEYKTRFREVFSRIEDLHAADRGHQRQRGHG